jgi:protein TonB
MRTRSIDRAGVLASIALHALAALALLSYEPARSALFAAAPVMIDLITPPKVEPRPQPPVELPRPRRPKPAVKPVVRQPDPPPVLATPVEAPTPVEVAPPPPAPPPPPPEPAPVAEAPLVAAPVSAPVFDADYLENPPPRYPARARRAGEQGRVILRVLVNPGGTADEVQIRDSSGHRRLDDAARETVRRWRFVPAKRGERAVPAWVLIPVSFSLED